jgi:hypothetical protein
MKTYTVEHRQVIPYALQLPLLGIYTVQAESSRLALDEFRRTYTGLESNEVLVIREPDDAK